MNESLKKTFKTKIRRFRARLRKGWRRSALRKLPETASKKLEALHLHISPRAITLAAIGIIIFIIVLPIVLSGGAGTSADASVSAEASVASATPGQVDIAEVTPSPSPTPSPTPEPTPTPFLLKRGMVDEEYVPAIQERLMELGYMDYDEPTTLYGPATKTAVELFQRKHDLQTDGCIGEITYALLMSDEAKKYTVSIGDLGEDVREMQKRLVELGYMDKATGLFGEETSAAVKKFQEKNGLTADGTIGEMTREKLYGEDVKANYYEIGESSEKIRTYQKRLIALGYLSGTADGKYGNATAAAVKKFQENNGLIADGYLGPTTIETLTSSSAQAYALGIGSSGSDVKSVQKKLISLNYLKGSADGYYGALTEKAVIAFQKNNSLAADGKVGAKTLSALNSGKAKKASSPVTSSSSSSSSKSTPKPSSSDTTALSSADGASVETLVAAAKSRLGCRYKKGAKGPNSFDCSGLVYWCLNQSGVKQGYMTSKSWRSVSKYQRFTSMSQIQAGDIVVFRMSASKGHVGIAISSSQMIDASSTDGVVRTTSLSKEYWKKYFYCAYRIF